MVTLMIHINDVLQLLMMELFVSFGPTTTNDNLTVQTQPTAKNQSKNINKTPSTPI